MLKVYFLDFYVFMFSTIVHCSLANFIISFSKTVIDFNIFVTGQKRAFLAGGAKKSSPKMNSNNASTFPINSSCQIRTKYLKEFNT